MGNTKCFYRKELEKASFQYDVAHRDYKNSF